MPSFAKKTYRDRSELPQLIAGLSEQEHFVIADAISEWYGAVSDGVEGDYQRRLQTDEEKEEYFETLQSISKALRKAGAGRGLR